MSRDHTQTHFHIGSDTGIIDQAPLCRQSFLSESHRNLLRLTRAKVHMERSIYSDRADDNIAMTRIMSLGLICALTSESASYIGDAYVLFVFSRLRNEKEATRPAVSPPSLQAVGQRDRRHMTSTFVQS